MVKDSRIIPQPLKGEVTVTIHLPPEATALMSDLHRDRQGIAVGGIILLICAVLATFKYLRTNHA